MKAMAFIELEEDALRAPLSRLTSEHSPQWGGMKPQQMVEHLIRSLRISQGTEKQTLKIPEEKLGEMRTFLFSEKPMPKEVKSATMLDEEGSYWYSDLEEAKEVFLKEWERFKEVYEQNPEKTENHPVFGELDRKGWEQVHRKHFTHHFQQFGLIEEG